MISKEVLEQLYFVEQLSQAEIAKREKTWQSLVCRALEYYGMKARPVGMRKGTKMPVGHSVMEKNANWKGGVKIRRDGRVLIRQTDKTYKRRSRIVLGVSDPSVHVHHKDEIKDNDTPENLQPLSNSQHRSLHCATQPRDSGGKFRKDG